MAEAKRRPGRPSKGKRGTFTFRISGGLRDYLEEAAAAAGRSVSEQIELVLEQMLLQERLLGGRDAAELVRQLFAIMSSIKAWTGLEWNEDERARRALQSSFSYLTRWKLGEDSDQLEADWIQAMLRVLEQRYPTRTIKLGDLRRNSLAHPEELGIFLARAIMDFSPQMITTAVVGVLGPMLEQHAKRVIERATKRARESKEEKRGQE